MSRDINANKRFELDREIMRIESQEDAFTDIKNQFESSLEKFHVTFKKLASKNEALLKETPVPHHYKQTNDMTENTYFNQRMTKYVDDQLGELSQVSDQVQSTLASAREKLVQERARLPWE